MIAIKLAVELVVADLDLNTKKEFLTLSFYTWGKIMWKLNRRLNDLRKS